MGAEKVYVPVVAAFDPEGQMLPREIAWEDGTTYDIDRVIDIRQAAAARVGGQGDRYTVEIGGRRSYIYFERSPDLSGMRQIEQGKTHRL